MTDYQSRFGSSIRLKAREWTDFVFKLLCISYFSSALLCDRWTTVFRNKERRFTSFAIKTQTVYKQLNVSASQQGLVFNWTHDGIQVYRQHGKVFIKRGHTLSCTGRMPIKDLFDAIFITSSHADTVKAPPVHSFSYISFVFSTLQDFNIQTYKNCDFIRHDSLFLAVDRTTAAWWVYILATAVRYFAKSRKTKISIWFSITEMTCERYSHY